MAEPMPPSSRACRITAEALGTALLLATVVGSGIMGERLAGGNVADRAARQHPRDRRGAGRAHPDVRADLGRPLQSRRSRWPTPSQGGLPLARRARRTSWLRSSGAFAGVAVAHVMFGEPLFFASQRTRARGRRRSFSEFVATFGLLAVIWGCARRRADRGAVRGGGIHHGGLLVHRLDVLRQPGGHAGARGHRHVRRHPPASTCPASSSRSSSAPPPPPCSSAGWSPARERRLAPPTTARARSERLRVRPPLRLGHRGHPLRDRDDHVGHHLLRLPRLSERHGEGPGRLARGGDRRVLAGARSRRAGRHPGGPLARSAAAPACS